MNRNYIISLAIGIAVVIWIFSGQGKQSQTAVDASFVEEVRPLTIVRGIKSTATNRKVELIVRGKTEENRQVLVRAEVSGRIESLPVAKGATVEKGDILCRIAIDSKDKSVIEAKAIQRQAALEYSGVKNLGRRGLQAETNVAKAKSRLESANAALSRALLQLEHTKVRSPFSGIVEQRPAELGDYLRVGDVCAQVLDADPILLTGQVAEKDIDHVKLGETISGSLITGESLTGTISYISQSADKKTRSYRVEAKVSNPQRKIRAGITSELILSVGSHKAHHISPAILVLDDNGGLGVKVVNAKKNIEFHSIKVIAEGPDGIWITGLPDKAVIVVVGQEIVFAGEQVKLDLSPLISKSKVNK